MASRSIKAQIKETLKALDKLKVQTIAMYPCSDPGYENIIKEYKKFEKKSFSKFIKI